MAIIKSNTQTLKLNAHKPFKAKTLTEHLESSRKNKIKLIERLVYGKWD